MVKFNSKNSRDLSRIQEAVTENKTVEFLLSPQEACKMAMILLELAAQTDDNKELVLLHVLCSRRMKRSALNDEIWLSRASVFAHAEVIPLECADVDKLDNEEMHKQVIAYARYF